jgi:cobalt-zinc-cadmium resistance protein CzcA
MINKITESALKAPGLVLLAIIAVIGTGVVQYRRMPVDAFPDISPIMVPVFAEGHGMAPEEIERLITYPIESAMNGLPDVTLIKSTSAFGMAVIYVYFKDSTDIYFARQLVGERLSSVMSELPETDEPPSLGPISTGLGQIFLYYLEADADVVDTGGKPLNTWLRELNDWVVKFQLQTVPGVTDILSIGGHVLQYQIRVNPNALIKYNLTLEDLVEVVNENNRNVGGQFLVLGSEEHLVRGIGLVESLDDIRSIAVKVEDGRPVLLSDVAEVEYGNEVRRGAVSLNGEKEVVSGLVLKLFGENTSEVIKHLYEKVESVKAALPEGVQLIPYYEQSELVENATWTVKKSLLTGGVLIVLVLLVFLGNIRAALMVAFSLTVCALIAIHFMGLQGVSANLMSLGGIAVAIGMLSDGAIVMMESILARLGESAGSEESKAGIIYAAACEVSRPIVFSSVIVVLVFLPIFTLQGVEGKMFSPMAFTVSAAMAGSVLAALIVIPVLSIYLLRRGGLQETVVVRVLKALYRPVLAAALRFKFVVMGFAAAALAASLALVPQLGMEFIPTMEEGSILISVTMAPSISLEKGTELIMSMEREITKFAAVDETISRIGRPEAGSHPHPVNCAEIHVELKPLSEWGEFSSKGELVEAINRRLKTFPGVQLNFTQPIQNAFDELLSGVRAQLAIKLFGEDLSVLREKAEEIRGAIANIPGLVDLSAEQSFGQPQVQVVADRKACARYGVSVGEIMQMVELAVGGEVIDNIYLGTRRFGINLRLQESFRSDPDALRNLLVSTSGGAVIPLSQVAEVKQVVGPIQINREANQRRWIVQGNVRGRDIGGVVADIQERIEKEVTLPPGYTIVYGGQFENQQRAMKRLSVIVPLVIVLVFVMLWISFGVFRHAMIIFIMVPLSVIGGICGLLLFKQYLSVPASVGFIALFGIAMLDGMVMVSCFNGLMERGCKAKEAVLNGSMMRLAPVLITTLTTLLGLLPLLLARGIGADVQRPLATVVVCGLATSTFLTLFLIPAVYVWVEEREEKKDGMREKKL